MAWLNNYWILFIIFQVQWWSCILGAKYQQVSLATIFVTITWILEFIILKIKWRQIRTIIAWTLSGVVLDSIQSYFGIISFKQGWNILHWLPPAWLIVLWFCFSTWMALSVWLRNYKFIVTLLCLLFAPLSYWAGMQLGALNLPYGLFSILSIAMGWLILITFMLNWPRNHANEINR